MGMCVSECGTELYGRLPMYLYQRGSGPNVVRKEEISCVKFQKSVVNFLCGNPRNFNWEKFYVTENNPEKFVNYGD